MKQRNRYIHFNRSLSGKVTILIIAAMVFCAVLWTAVMFVNMTGNANDNAMADEKAYMQRVEANAQSVEEVCNLAKQIVSQTYPIMDYIKLVQQGKDLDAVEKIDFYNNDIEAINNMTNINPYLYQIRLFVNAEITEKKPCLYKMERMANMDWADRYVSGAWQIDYIDKVFPDSVNENRHLAGIISEIRDDDGTLLAVLEVSTEIENLLTGFDCKDGTDLTCFVHDNGQMECSKETKTIWEENQAVILEDIARYDANEPSRRQAFHGTTGIVSILQLPSLDGVLVHVRNIDSTVASYYRSQTPYILVVLISMMLFIVVVVILINNIFRRFNTLTAEVNQIKNGATIRLTEQGEDEISELGRQINNMVSSLEQLNKENTNRQLLVKNAEIKGLQNQINAHFMYNVLETIKMMAEIKEDYEISDAITSLGEMFRYSVKWSSGLVTLEEEIKYIRNYLDLLNLRFDYEIYLSLNIPEQYQKLRIPKMSLQPLVENSVYHGIEDMAEDTSIYIKVYEENEIIHIEVSDAGAGMDEEALIRLRNSLNDLDGVDEQQDHGRALYNVSQRIKMYFGQAYGLQIFSEKGVYTKVLIQIPKVGPQMPYDTDETH